MKKTGDWKLDRDPSTPLLKELRKRFHDGVFLMDEVYDAYWDVCYTYKPGSRFEGSAKTLPKAEAIVDDQFLQMNARNAICEATHRGIMKQVGRGVYCFL